MNCVLCQSENLSPLRHQQWDVAFFRCGTCDLIFRDPASFPDWNLQKDRYDQHNNSEEDPRYLAYFQPFIKTLMDALEMAQLKRGLDWGAGPGPVLSQELERLGFDMQIYDPIYQPEKPEGLFDFVTATEVIEHFQDPRKSLEEVLSHIKRGGIFAGMTNFHQGPEKFFDWWYAKDFTHVCFYSEKTWSWIERRWSLRCLYLRSPRFIFQKMEGLKKD